MEEIPKKCPKCGAPMQEFTVKKEGKNHGRKFYTCILKPCDGFEWAKGEATPQTPQVETSPLPLKERGDTGVTAVKIACLHDATNLTVALIKAGKLDGSTYSTDIIKIANLFEKSYVAN